MTTLRHTRLYGDVVSGNATLIMGLCAAVIVTTVTIAEIAGANWHLVLYALISLLFPLMVALFRIKQFGVTEPGALFLAFFAGYNGFLLCRIAVGDLSGNLRMPYPVQYSSDIYTQAAFLSFIFSIMLGGTLLLLGVRPAKRAIQHDDVNLIASAGLPVGLAFFAIGLIFFFINLSKIGGLQLAMGISKVERFQLSREAGLFLPFMPFATIGLVFMALGFWKTHRLGVLATLMGALVLWVALGFAIGDRTASAYAFLAVIGLMAFLRSWKLSYKLVLFAIVVYLAFTVYAQVRWIIPHLTTGNLSSQAASDWVQENTAADWILPENNEFAGPYLSLVYAIDNQPRLRWGSSYLEGFVFFIPSKLYPNKPMPITDEFAIEIHSRFANAYFPAAGWGYSPVAEAYVNFSLAGVVLVPIAFGVMLDLLERLRWKSALPLLCVTAILPQMQNANRINFLWTWTEAIFSIVVCILAVMCARFVAQATTRNRRIPAVMGVRR